MPNLPELNSLSWHKFEAGVRQPKPEMYEAIAELYAKYPAKVVAGAFSVSLRTVRRAVRKHEAFKLRGPNV